MQSSVFIKYLNVKTKNNFLFLKRKGFKKKINNAKIKKANLMIKV